jgi:integrase
MYVKRPRVQFGWIDVKTRKREPSIWVLRYRETQSEGKRTVRSISIGSKDQYPTEAHARKASMSLLLAINTENSTEVPVTLGAVIDRYLAEELPARHSTARGYRSWLNLHIKPRWRDFAIGQVKPVLVEGWLAGLNLAPKSKAHLKNLMRLLFTCAMRWELVPYQHNPMSLVRVKDASKRIRQPIALSVKQFQQVLELIPEPYHAMCLVSACLGLRISEVLGLRWSDFDWEKQQLRIRRSWVCGRIDQPKTETSKKPMPVDPKLTKILLEHRTRLPASLRMSEWVFPSKRTGMPSHPWTAARNWLVPAGMKAGVGRMGWHTFRHTYSTLLNEHGTDMKVQQELLRHADIRTTMNIYTQAVPERLRQANSKIVSILLPTGTA